MSDYVGPGGPSPKEPVKKTASAKEISKWSMVVGAMWIGLLCLLRGFWPMFKAGTEFGMDVQEIILSGAALAAVFSPVYLSILLDKIKGVEK